MKNLRGDRAVVIGASMAGLLAARVLSEFYAEVIVLDRDRLPDEVVPRNGVPQMRHSHALLARGREVVEELLPGFTAELVEKGAALADVQERPSFFVDGAPLATARSGLLALGVSRPLLEHHVRGRVAALTGVELREHVSVVDLVMNKGSTAVTGVAITDPERPGNTEELLADLVVDASGRTSRVVDWLERRGFAAPPKEAHRIDVAYATRTFSAPAGTTPDRAILQPVTPEVPRSAVLLPQEGGLYTVSIAGYHGDRPPTDLTGFVSYARSVPGPLADFLGTLHPVDDGLRYRFPVNVRRRFERLTRFPSGLLVIGDAICAFDPAFGQGMSVAALEARELRACLQAGGPDLAGRYFKRAARHVDTAWTVTVGRDLQLPGSTEAVPFSQRLVGGYLAALVRGGVHDPVLATGFLRVTHLAATPQSLLAPRYAVRVARSALAAALRPASASSSDAGSPDSPLGSSESTEQVPAVRFRGGRRPAASGAAPAIQSTRVR